MEVWDQDVGSGSWNLNFVRTLNDWELDMVGKLLSDLQKVKVTSELDRISWLGAENDSYSVRAAYKVLQPGTNLYFLSKGIWDPNVPTKSAFYAWKAVWGKVLTLEKLQRRGWQLPYHCYLCGCAEDSINHILLHCFVVSSCWDIIFAIVGVHWVFPKTVKEAIISWRGEEEGLERRPVLYFLDSLEGGKLAGQRLKNSFVSNPWSWNSLYLGDEASSLIGFLEWLAFK